MRIHFETAEKYIQLLAGSINKDPSSLAAWQCLHIHPVAEQQVSHKAISDLQHRLKDFDCDVLICSDGDLLFITRELSKQTLNSLALELAETIEDAAPDIVIYDLFHDWRLIRDLLFSKITIPLDLGKNVGDANKFGDVENFKEVFTEAKNLRPARNPQYILLVEDDNMTRRMLATVYKEKYALISAQNAFEAVEKYLLYAPDIVFLDIGLPDASGFDVLRQIIEADADAYVVMFSGNSYLDNVLSALNAGASGFVSKPFKKDKMDKYIADAAFHHRKQCI